MKAPTVGGGMGAETLCYLSLHDLSGRIRRGDVSPVEAVEAFLQRIEQLHPRPSAFLTLCAHPPFGEAEDAGGRNAPRALAGAAPRRSVRNKGHHRDGGGPYHERIELLPEPCAV